jgi:hypothetical protein
MPVLVEDATEAIASVDVKAGGGSRPGDRWGQREQRPGVGDSLMRPVGIVELLELAPRVQQVQLVPDQGVPLENRTCVVTCGLRISGGARILVDQATQDGFSEDRSAVKVGNGEVSTVVFAVGDALRDALVRPGRVVVHLHIQPGRRGDAPPRGSSTRFRSSRRRVPTRRSQIAFIRGARPAVRTILVPAAWKTASNEAVKFDPRSRIRNLMSANRSPRVRARYSASFARSPRNTRTARPSTRHVSR